VITIGQFRSGVAALSGLQSSLPTLQAVISEGFANLPDDMAVAEDILAIACDIDPRLVLALDALELIKALVPILISNQRLQPVGNAVLTGQTTPPVHGWIGR
jgi:hypothetical protein